MHLIISKFFVFMFFQLPFDILSLFHMGFLCEFVWKGQYQFNLYTCTWNECKTSVFVFHLYTTIFQQQHKLITTVMLWWVICVALRGAQCKHDFPLAVRSIIHFYFFSPVFFKLPYNDIFWHLNWMLCLYVYFAPEIRCII